MAAAQRSLRPASADDLGMRRALSGWLLPALSAAMVFLAALAMAGAMAAAGLAAHWAAGAASTITVTVPDMAGRDAADAAGRALASAPSVASARRLPPREVALLIKPWLGMDPSALSLRLPSVFEVRTKPGVTDAGLEARLIQAAPGTLVEHNGEWLTRLADLVRSLQACATLALLIVAFTAAAVVGVASRAGIAARRDAIEIVHGLGATDRLIAGQFARRISVLVLTGAVAGAILAVPVLLELSTLAAPFGTSGHGIGAGLPEVLRRPAALLTALPPLLWIGLAGVPVAAGLIGWLTAQTTVRVWLRRLP